MAAASPCASRGEIGALFGDFLGRSAPEITSLAPATGPRKKRKSAETTESTDSDSADVSKKARRRMQNRVAAQTSREKKKKYLTNLESQVQALNQQNMDLQSRLLALEEENKRLKQGQGVPPPMAPQMDPMIRVKSEPAEPVFHKSLSSLMQTPNITFESAVFYFPQQSEVMKGFVLMLNLAFLASQALLASPKNLFRSSSPKNLSRSTTSPATTESSISPSAPSPCLPSAKKKLPSRALADTSRRRNGFPPKKSRLVTAAAVAA